MTVARRMRFASLAGMVGTLAWAFVVGVSLAQAQATASFPGDPIEGRRAFLERDCARCHSIWGNGGRLGPDFALVGAGRSLHQLAGMFWNHTPRMIETVRDRGLDWPQFTEDELANLISYIYYVKLFDEPGDPDLGERWFQEKHCRECHSVGGNGGRIGGTLDDYARYRAPIALAQGMWNDGPTMQAAQARQGVALPTFLGREIADIQAFIRRESSLQPREIELLTPPDPNRGQRLFAAKACARCHGPAGRGTVFGPDLRTATQRLRVSEIAGTLWNHSSRMMSAMQARGVAFPQFAGAEMADVIAFLYYLRFYDLEGNAETGEQLFVTKGCVTCHSRDGSETTGPDLSRSSAVLTPLGLATAMWDHAPAMYDRALLQRMDWPLFEGDEMRDLALYLRRLARSSIDTGGGNRP